MTSHKRKSVSARHPNRARLATRLLLNWYDRRGRDLPWRVRAPLVPDPYRVWLSEIMLQRTTVVVVRPYYEAFVRLYPTLGDLARARDDDVMAAWAGLGYYARARNMLRCARILTDTQEGRFPADEKALRTLPGIGPYTAAAVSAIAFGRRTAPVDGNVERVVSRAYALTTRPPALGKYVTDAFAPLVPEDRPGDFVQAMMDLGATVCMPARPHCATCPWRRVCDARDRGLVDALPLRKARPPVPRRTGTVLWLENARGEVLMKRRPNRGLLGGMLAFPTCGWDDGCDDGDLISSQSGGKTLPATVGHVFSHFRLTLTIRIAATSPGLRTSTDHLWIPVDRLDRDALPGVMRKVADAVAADPDRQTHPASDTPSSPRSLSRNRSIGTKRSPPS